MTNILAKLGVDEIGWRRVTLLRGRRISHEVQLAVVAKGQLDKILDSKPSDHWAVRLLG